MIFTLTTVRIVSVDVIDMHTNTIETAQYAGSKRYQKLQDDSPPKNLTVVCSPTDTHSRVSIPSDSLQRHF